VVANQPSGHAVPTATEPSSKKKRRKMKAVPVENIKITSFAFTPKESSAFYGAASLNFETKLETTK
jgi:hypothetical protein